MRGYDGVMYAYRETCHARISINGEKGFPGQVEQDNDRVRTLLLQHFIQSAVTTRIGITIMGYLR